MVDSAGSRQPRIRHNDYTPLKVPALSEWEPLLPLSVVVPATGTLDRLAVVLTSLAAQSYPDRLVETIIVQDESAPPLTLPEERPLNSRVVTATAVRSRTRAGMVPAGLAVADGEVLLWLAPDTLLDHQHIEAHLRWHHLADYLTVAGRSGPIRGEGGVPAPGLVRTAIREGRVSELLDPVTGTGDRLTALFDEMVRSPETVDRAFWVTSGDAVSVNAQAYRAAGGIDPDLPMGTGAGIEFGYRLAQAGAVFVPDASARAWRFDTASTASAGRPPQRSYLPLVSNRVPVQREWRSTPGRQWKVPYVDVVVDTTGSSFEQVSATVVGTLASTLPDVGVTIIGQWSTLVGDRPAGREDPTPMDEWLETLSLVREAFADDGRVQLKEDVPATSAPAPFRFTCPAGLVPTTEALPRLIELADTHQYGVILLAFPTRGDLQIARLERTRAMARSLALADPSEEVLDVVEEMFGTYWLDGAEWALVAAAGRSDDRAGSTQGATAGTTPRSPAPGPGTHD